MNTDKRSLPFDELDGLLLDVPDSPSTRFSAPNGFSDWLLGLNWLFIFTVVLPTTAAVIYYGFIATPVYVSHSSFTVQSVKEQESSGGGGIASLLKGSSSGSADADIADVEEFIQSRDALRQLIKEADLPGAFGNSKIDFFARFGGGTRWWDRSFEGLYRYYSKRILDVETSELDSSIIEIQVKAFSPEEAALINSKLLDMGETLVNALNERLQQDMVRFAQMEVDDAEKAAEAAYVALAAYRNANTIVDPTQQSSLQLNLIQTLQEKLIETRNQLAEVTRSSENNPQIPSLQRQVDRLESEIQAEMAKTAGATSSFSSKASRYEKLMFEKDFSEKQLTDALTFLDTSRNEAQRKQLYLKRIVEPDAPDFANEPRRMRNILATMVAGFVIWGVLALFAAGVREHQQ